MKHCGTCDSLARPWVAGVMRGTCCLKEGALQAEGDDRDHVELALYRRECTMTEDDWVRLQDELLEHGWRLEWIRDGEESAVEELEWARKRIAELEAQEGEGDE